LLVFLQINQSSTHDQTDLVISKSKEISRLIIQRQQHTFDILMTMIPNSCTARIDHKTVWNKYLFFSHQLADRQIHCKRFTGTRSTGST